MIASNTTTAGALANKIASISAELSGRVEQDGTNSFSKYKYISYEQLNALTAPLLRKYNIAFVPSFDDIQETDFDSGGKHWIRTVIKGSVTIIDGDTGEQYISRIIGVDQDTGGKSAAQAITEACKRYFFKLFFVSSKGDIDPDSKTTPTPTMAKAPIKQAPDVITDAQRRELMTEAQKSGYPLDKIPELLKRYGYERSNQIHPKDFNNIKEEIISLGASNISPQQQERATEKQVAFMFAEVHKRGYSDDEFKAKCKEFGCSHRNEILKKDVDAILARMPDKQEAAASMASFKDAAANFKDEGDVPPF